MEEFYIPVRRVVYRFLGIINEMVQIKHADIFILCYHSISEDGWRFSVKLEEFKKQINYLKNKGCQFITLSELLDYLNGKKELTKQSVIISFDDGYKDILQIKDFLRDQNIKPALFLLSDTNHANREEIGTGRDFLSKDDILRLIEAGWEIGSHSATHANMDRLNDDGIAEEIVKSRESLEKELGISIKYFAYPKGKYNPKILSAIKKAGYKLALTMDDGEVTRRIDHYLIPRIGVDGTHSFAEFKTLFLQLVIKLRGFLKRIGYGK